MLTEIQLQQFAIIQHLQVAPANGLVAVTGETGSGKSLLLDAVELVLSKRLKPQQYLLSPTDKGRVELTFDLSQHPKKQDCLEILEEQGIECDLNTETLVLSREFSAQSSRARIQGTMVAMEVMEQLAPYLMELYGQHDLHQLFSAARQRQLLDALGGEPLETLLGGVKQTFKAWQQAQKQLETLKQAQSQREQELDFTRFQVAEIEAAMPITEGEDEQLGQERNKLASGEQLMKDLAATLSVVESDEPDSPNVLVLLGRMNKHLSQAIQVDSSLSPLGEQLSSVQAQLDDVAREVSRYRDQLRLSPEALEQVLERLDVLNKLKRKYGGTLAAVIDQYRQLQERLSQLENQESILEDLQQQVSQLEQQYYQQAELLTALRKQLVPQFEQAVHNHLEALLLPYAQFGIELAALPKPTEAGLEQITFLFVANPAPTQPNKGLKPLSMVASGGELARVMLAIKLSCLEAGGSTLILDEIDAGLSGQALKALAEKLDQLAQQGQQIITVTHHPLLAAKASQQWHLQKHQQAGQLPNVAIELLATKPQRDKILKQMTSGEVAETSSTAETWVQPLLQTG